MDGIYIAYKKKIYHRLPKKSLRIIYQNCLHCFILFWMNAKYKYVCIYIYLDMNCYIYIFRHELLYIYIYIYMYIYEHLLIVGKPFEFFGKCLYV